MLLAKKNILFIAPKFFGYENSIRKELEKRQANVHIIYENLEDYSLFYRLMLRLIKPYRGLFMLLYYKYKLRKVLTSIDILFVIRGHSLPKEIVEILKSENPNCICIMYQWDSVKNNPNALNIKDHFNKVYSFDMVDSLKYGWVYRPLFFRSQGIIPYENRKYDIAFICSLHSKRFYIYKQLLEMKKKGLKVFLYLYSSYYSYLIGKYIKRDPLFREVKTKDITFFKMKESKISEIYLNSRIIVDYTHPNQNGYTIRTIESLGNSCKLITNNKKILGADFYSPKNIMLYTDKICLDNVFVREGYQNVPPELISNYSLESWIDFIFDEK